MDLPNKDLEHPEKSKKQAEAEVVPSSSLVEVEVDATLSFRHSLDDVQILFRVDGEMGIKANLIVVEVEAGVELGN